MPKNKHAAFMGYRPGIPLYEDEPGLIDELHSLGDFIRAAGGSEDEVLEALEKKGGGHLPAVYPGPEEMAFLRRHFPDRWLRYRRVLE